MFRTFLSLLWILDIVNAVRIPVQAHRKPRNTILPRNSVSIKDDGDTKYFANITIGGELKSVNLDTGSSDLWIAGNLSQTTDLGISTSLFYAIGVASGNVNVATFQWGNYTVENQAYLLVTNTTDLPVSGDEQGLLGLGPDSSSVISNRLKEALAATPGENPLTRIFQQNRTSQNYITILLARENGTGDNFASGEITISEVVPGFEDVLSMTEVVMDTAQLAANQHFQVLTETTAVIGPDGSPIDILSTVPGVTDGRLVAVFDSGFSLPQVPRKIADAIYGRVNGAAYDADLLGGAWTIPCDQYLNISFNIGGRSYPVHPLDLNSDILGHSTTGNCAGLFQPIGQGAFAPDTYDMILGMGFLRNAYALFDFGDFVTESSNDRGDPFVKLLSITNSTAAKDDFIRLRLGGIDSTDDKGKALLPASKGQHSPLRPDEIAAGILPEDADDAKGEGEKASHESADQEDIAALSEGDGNNPALNVAESGALSEDGSAHGIKARMKKYWPYILAGGLAILAIIAGCIAWFCRGDRRRRTWKGRAVTQRKSYKPLHAPAPQAE